jgi:hypothetical protein
MEDLFVDLFCGLGGWTEGFLAEGYYGVGYDIEAHDYGTGGYPGNVLILQDVLTVHGSAFKDASVIVASPPCQNYSYMAMPWSKAKALAAWYREKPERIVELNALFNACFRIQREACEAAGRYIPLIVENVRGAQPWVGRSAWNYGSYHLWGDVPALMPFTSKQYKKTNCPPVPLGELYRKTGIPNHCHITGTKVSGFRFDGSGKSFQFESVKVTGQYWSRYNRTGEVSPHWRLEGLKTVEHLKVGGDWFGSYQEQKEAGTISPGRLHGKNSAKRKAASAQIAKIPFPLAQHIARCFKMEMTA